MSLANSLILPKFNLHNRWNKPSIAEKLEAFSIPITECGCRIWVGGTVRSRNGMLYPKIKIDGKDFLAHRISLELFNGSQILPAHEVHHLCFITLCINPSHLITCSRSHNSKEGFKKKKKLKISWDVYWKTGQEIYL